MCTTQKKYLIRRQGNGRRIGLGDRILVALAECVASVFLDQTVELNRLFKKDRSKTASGARGTVELNSLFQKDRGKTASAARILSPNPTQ